jgi:hypothetical protein
MRAIGIEVMHKQAYMMATLVQELRNEEQFMTDFAHGVVWRQASLDDFLSVVLLCTFGFLGLSLIRSRDVYVLRFAETFRDLAK